MLSSTSIYTLNACLVSLWATFLYQTPYTDLYVDERRLLADVPNALAYHRIIETGVGGFLVRQYIHSSLYDRLR